MPPFPVPRLMEKPFDNTERVMESYRMTTTIALTSKNQCTIPKSFVESAGLKPETQLRVTQIAGGLYITPIPEPTEEEFRRVLKLSGASKAKKFTKKDNDMLNQIIKESRAAQNKSRS